MVVEIASEKWSGLPLIRSAGGYLLFLLARAVKTKAKPGKF